MGKQDEMDVDAEAKAQGLTGIDADVDAQASTTNDGSAANERDVDVNDKIASGDDDVDAKAQDLIEIDADMDAQASTRNDGSAANERNVEVNDKNESGDKDVHSAGSNEDSGSSNGGNDNNAHAGISGNQKGNDSDEELKRKGVVTTDVLEDTSDEGENEHDIGWLKNNFNVSYVISHNGDAAAL